MNWEELFVKDSLQEECNRLELFLSPSNYTTTNFAEYYLDLPLFSPFIKLNAVHLGCKRARLTRSKYLKEPLSKRIATSLAFRDHTFLKEWPILRSTEFIVERPNLKEPNAEREDKNKATSLELAISEKRPQRAHTLLFVRSPALRISKEYLELKNAVPMPKLHNLTRRDSCIFSLTPFKLNIPRQKLTFKKFPIISNLALFQEHRLYTLLEEFCVIYEREDDCEFPIIQTSPTRAAILLKPSSTLDSVPDYVTDALFVCTERERIPNRLLLLSLYAKRLKVSFALSLTSLKRFIMILGSQSCNYYLTEVESAHERLLTKGLGKSSFQAQYLLSKESLKDILGQKDIFGKVNDDCADQIKKD